RVEQVLRVVLPLRLARLHEQGEQVLAADERDVGDGHVQAGVAGVADEGGTGRVGADGDDEVGPSLLQNLDLLLEAVAGGGAAAVGGLAGDLQVMFGQGGADAVPAAAAVGVDLVEDGDALVADLDEVIDQAGGLL